MRIVISYLISLSYLYHYNQVKLQFSGFPVGPKDQPHPERANAVAAMAPPRLWPASQAFGPS